MNANSLMIGDWVADSHGFIRVDIDALNWINEYPLEPIPLTPEIIEANNLCLGRNVFKHNFGPFEDDTIIDIRRNVIMFDDIENKEFWVLHLRNKECNCFEGGVISMNLNLLYVHQFQHALRVVGLTELADNFKVTTT